MAPAKKSSAKKAPARREAPEAISSEPAIPVGEPAGRVPPTLRRQALVREHEDINRAARVFGQEAERTYIEAALAGNEVRVQILGPHEEQRTG